MSPKDTGMHIDLESLSMEANMKYIPHHYKDNTEYKSVLKV